MIDCQIKKDGKIEENVTQDGLVFLDNKGLERSNHIDSPVMEASLKEWFYQKFGIMNQHYLGKENNCQFIADHEVRPALLFSIAIQGSGMKKVYGEHGNGKEMIWKTGDASLCFLNGAGGANTYLNRETQLDILSVVIPQQFIDDFILHNPEALEQLSYIANPAYEDQTIIKENQQVEASVIKAARDIQRSRLLGNLAPTYLESKITDCISGLLSGNSLLPNANPFNFVIRDKMHNAKDIILAHYQDMPSLHELSTMVGTNECTLKKAFKQEFGTTVFQYLFDYRMSLATQYLLDTTLPIADIGIRLGYDYPSHFCTAFKRKFGVSPIEYRQKRGNILLLG